MKLDQIKAKLNIEEDIHCGMWGLPTKTMGLGVAELCDFFGSRGVYLVRTAWAGGVSVLEYLVELEPGTTMIMNHPQVIKHIKADMLDKYGFVPEKIWPPAANHATILEMFDYLWGMDEPFLKKEGTWAAIDVHMEMVTLFYPNGTYKRWRSWCS
jgi:hypothetical protein